MGIFIAYFWILQTQKLTKLGTVSLITHFLEENKSKLNLEIGKNPERKSTGDTNYPLLAGAGCPPNRLHPSRSSREMMLRVVFVHVLLDLKQIFIDSRLAQ